MNIVFHIRGGQFEPFRPPGNVTGGPQKRLKTALFGPKWPYLAIGSPSKPKWVEHWLNMVEHCQTHPGGSVWAFMAPKNVTRGPQKRSKTAFFGPKWPYLAISSPSKRKWVEHWLNMVEHCQTHPGGSVWAIRAPKNVTREPPEAPENGLFWLKIGHFWVLLGLLGDTFLGP